MARSGNPEVTAVTSPPSRLAVRVKQAALLLSVSERTLNRFLESGQLRSIRARGTRLIPLDAIEAFLAGDENGSRS